MPSDVIYLGADQTGLVLDARGPGLPVVLHWGAALGRPTTAELATLPGLVSAPLPTNTPEVEVRASLLPEAAGGYAGRPGLRGHRAGQAWTPSFTLMDVRRAGDGSLVVEAADANAGLRLLIEVELVPSGLCRFRQRLSNLADDPYVLDGLELAVPLPPRATELLDLSGRWARERQPQRHRLQLGSWVREGRRGRTGHDATLALLAGTAGFGFRSGEVWGIHVAWSGNHVTYAERLPEGQAVLGGGELLMPGEVILTAGEEYTSPWIYAAYSQCGLDGLSAVFHRWLRSRPQHPGPARPRPVILNTWEAVYFDLDPARLRRLADVAARIGVERFVVDDGWFRHRRNSRAGLGDWFVDETRWPGGLTRLIDHVRDLGMEFGLWVEPEMVNPDSDLYRAHPDWVLAPGRDELPPSVRHQQVLDLALPAAYAYVLERLDTLLRDYDIAYLKWDHNRDLIAAGHEGRAGVHTQTAAVYRLLAELRARHPDVEIESCSSGGARVDLEILAHTDRVWASDCNDALERQLIQRWTALLLPPELIGAHVGPPRAHTTGRTHDLSFRVATALFGHFGIEWDITAATAAEQAALAEAIAFYKRIRRLLQAGETVRADHPDPAALVHGVVGADATEALFAYVQLTTSERALPARVRLPGLDPDRQYTVSVVMPAGGPRTVQQQPPGDAPVLGRWSGRVLDLIGIQAPILAPEQAWLLHLVAEASDPRASGGIGGLPVS